jgi:ribosomal protein S18 acetylase RimI-like enzyme
MNSLKDEKTTFSLNYEKVMASAHLSVISNDKGEWLGMAGYRKIGMVSLFFLVVHRDAQNLGLGRKLTAMVLNRVYPWQLMLLTVTRSNLKARRLYDAFGFHTLQRGREDVVMALSNSIMRLTKPLLWLALNLRGYLKR